MPIEKDNRSIGIVVSNMFENAFSSFRGGVYKVVDIVEAKERLRVSEATYNNLKHKLRLINPDNEFDLPDFPKRNNYENDEDYYHARFNFLQFRVPKKVLGQMTDELGMIRCSKCGYLTDTRHMREEKCPKCSSKMVQAPILISTQRERRRRRPPKIFLPIRSRKCRLHNVWMHLISTDPAHPMGSLKTYCTQCGIDRASKYFYGGYQPIVPTTNVIQGLTVDDATIKEESKELKFSSLDDLRYIDRSFIGKKIEVYQVTVGYCITRYHYNYVFPFQDGKVVYSRKFETNGFAMKLDPKIYQVAKDHLGTLFAHEPEYFQRFERDLNKVPALYQEQLRRWVLHSLEHALLAMLPLITGLDYAKFTGSYDTERNLVIIYDNEYGGIGGCRSILSEEIFDRYLSATKRNIERCDCRNRCPNCIATSYCGELNNALNRHLLAPIFDIETYYE